MQVAVVLAILATAGLTSLRQSGWQLSAWTVTVGTAWLGVASVVYPHHAGSFGLLGGSAAILWAILFAGATLRSVRHFASVAPEVGRTDVDSGPNDSVDSTGTSLAAKARWFGPVNARGVRDRVRPK
jgi:hypothetical protein